jgi:hypothetical protein
VKSEKRKVDKAPHFIPNIPFFTFHFSFFTQLKSQQFPRIHQSRLTWWALAEHHGNGAHPIIIAEQTYVGDGAVGFIHFEDKIVSISL